MPAQKPPAGFRSPLAPPSGPAAIGPDGRGNERCGAAGCAPSPRSIRQAPLPSHGALRRAVMPS